MCFSNVYNFSLHKVQSYHICLNHFQFNLYMVMELKIKDWQCFNYCHLPSDFSSKSQSFLTIYSRRCRTNKNFLSEFGTYDMQILIIHDTDYKLMHKKCIREFTTLTWNNIWYPNKFNRHLIKSIVFTSITMFHGTDIFPQNIPNI